MEKQIDHILEPLFSWWNGFGTSTAPGDFANAGEESKSRLRELLAEHMEKESCVEKEPYDDLIAYNSEIFAKGSRVYEARSVDWKIKELESRQAAEMADELAELETLVKQWKIDGFSAGHASDLQMIIDKRKGKDAEDDDGYHQIQECGGCGEMYIISLIETCSVCDQLLCTDCLPKEEHGCWEEEGDDSH